MPDIELPETVPVYVIAVEPTVPKVIALPLTVPLMGRVLRGFEILIVPCRCVPDCRHVSANVPL